MKNLGQLIINSTSKFSTRHSLNKNTYNCIYKKSNVFSHIIRNNNLLKNNCVCVYGTKSIDWISVMLATFRTGNIFVPLPYNNTALSKYIIDTLKPSLVFSDTFFENDTCNYPLSGINMHNITDFSFDNFSESHEPAIILFTSGSTKEPKGVVLSHHNIISNLNGIQNKYKDTINVYDKSFSILPWHHCYGLVCELLYLLKNGSSIVTPVEKNFFKEIKWESPTLLFLVPKVIETIYKNDIKFVPNFLKKKYLFGNNLRMVSVGGSFCNPNLITYMNDTFNIPVYQGYGLSETSPMVSLNSPIENKVGSVGKLLDNVKIKIINNEILVSGDSLMLGYVNRNHIIDDARTSINETTKSIRIDSEHNVDVDFHDLLNTDKNIKEWFNTGDTGYIDKDGYLFINGRSTSRYKLDNGKYIDPEYLEKLLMVSPIIEEIVIYGVIHNVAIVKSKYERTVVLKEIERILHDKVEKYEIPKEVILVDPNEPFFLTQKLEPNRKKVIKKYFERSKSSIFLYS
jgi:long-chain acyl-CoA synthetase